MGCAACSGILAGPRAGTAANKRRADPLIHETDIRRVESVAQSAIGGWFNQQQGAEYTSARPRPARDESRNKKDKAKDIWLMSLATRPSLTSRVPWRSWECLGAKSRGWPKRPCVGRSAEAGPVWRTVNPGWILECT